MRPWVLAGLLAGCAKPAPPPAAADEAEEPAVVAIPEGFAEVKAPSNFRSLRPLASAALPDGSFAIAGSAIRLVQYQWVMRVPAQGVASQTVFDPGRIEWIGDNGTAGLDAAGTLGGVPEDKAWYGEVDAFGKLGTRQTYLSDGNGQFKGLVRLADGLAAAGDVVDAAGRMQGWIVRTDLNGKDLWKTRIGEGPAQGLTWIQEQGGVFVAGGWSMDQTEDPWVTAVDQSGAVILDAGWKDPAWTRLSSGIVLPDGDLMTLGISAPAEQGALDGSGSLWVGRMRADGTAVWDRSERSDLSVVTRGVRWGSGMAVAALRGPLGTPRKVLVARITDEGQTTWTEPDLPEGIGWAQLHALDEQLLLIATIETAEGLAYRQIALEGAAAP